MTADEDEETFGAPQATTSEVAKRSFDDERLALHERLKQSARIVIPSALKYAAPVVIAVSVVAPNFVMQWVFLPLIAVSVRILGVAVGVALGLGLAAHVYDVLTELHEKQKRYQEEGEDLQEFGSRSLRNSSNKLITRSQSILQLGKSPSQVAAASFEDEQTFRSLLLAAGFDRDPGNRGQVIRSDTPWLNEPNYGYDRRIDASPLPALAFMQEYWPTLPPQVIERLSLLSEYVIRDFIASWYGFIDLAVNYKDAREVKKEQQEKEGNSRLEEKLGEKRKKPDSGQRGRVMLYTMASHRHSPFLSALYSSMSVIFGNLATRVEHVNVPSLLLLRWTRILAHTFKVYRSLRKSVLNKNHPTGRKKKNRSENETRGTVSEIEMTKEFLFAGKLHKAVIFGLDIPSLLFADSSGKDCGVPGRKEAKTDDEVLARRLFDTKMITECELDYNRVIGHRMVRALLTRQDFGSPIVSTILTEIMASCVLTPMMSCFCPDYLNGWIIQGLSSSSPDDGTADTENTHFNAEVEPETTAATHFEESFFTPTASDTKRVLEKKNNSLKLSKDEENRVKVDDGLLQYGKKGRDTNNDTLNGVPPVSAENTVSSSTQDSINSLLALALIDLQQFVDFEDYRAARSSQQEVAVNWDDAGCRAAVLRLVLVLELALTNGRCTYRSKESKYDANDDLDSGEIDDLSEKEVEVTLPEYESATLSQILMEMTSDVDAFEERVSNETNQDLGKHSPLSNGMEVEEYKPTVGEQSTLRTLIAAWLHTGQVFRNVSVLAKAHTTVLGPFYRDGAFMRSQENVDGFVRQLKALDDVDILVDTMTVLASPRLDETESGNLHNLVQSSVVSSPSAIESQARSQPHTISSAHLFSSTSTNPRYLDFHRNESFASSLRSERERRMLSWQSSIKEEDEDSGNPVCRSKGVSQEDTALHRELHHLSRIFYTGTNQIGIRDAAKRKDVSNGDNLSETETMNGDDGLLSLVTVETVSPRRRIEVPDDDSSFLLRAQPRPLNAVGVHRDQRNHDQSFKCFVAIYEEPVAATQSSHVSNGKFLRRCLMRYHPNSRTAQISLLSDARKFDQRKSSVPSTITLDQNSRNTPFLSSEFLRDRHLCHRYVPRGTARSQSILASSVVEPADFTSMPRPGKALDFVYRLSFFEKPMIDLRGHYFTIHDSAALGVHRSDASAMELSDASLSAALYMLGDSGNEIRSETASTSVVQMGKDGYPVIWMKFTRKQDDAQVEVKPYRLSFVRAALMITASRQEAQLQCLISCVKAGSAKNATRAFTDARLKPTSKLVEYAGHRSREKQSLLLRDLKLGVNHIDRQQLRRNGLLDPRYPTELLDFSATIEDAIQSQDDRPGADFFGVSATVYRIRCTAKIRYVEVGTEDYDGADTRGYGQICQEEWLVLRTFKEFQALHRHLKNQVAANLSSGTPASRLVGAATAAFAPVATPQGRHRQAFVPSLSQASKAGALGVTKKSISKRREILNDYLSYLLSPRNPIRTCSELTLFLGAFYPLPREIRAGETLTPDADILGRTEMSRNVLEEQHQSYGLAETNKESKLPDNGTSSKDVAAHNLDRSISGSDAFGELPEGEDSDVRRQSKKIDMIPAIRSKIEKVPLAQVRSRVFELLRFQFGFENASFIRNRMLAALRTASLAVTSPGEFQRTLYKLHTEHLSGKAVGDLIQLGLDLLWPDGVFAEPSVPETDEVIQGRVHDAKRALHSSFPEAVRTVLGNELTEDGLDIFHEMLQNRLVVKSMAYMLFDLLWLEVFPEIGDVLQCGAVLDIDVV